MTDYYGPRAAPAAANATTAGVQPLPRAAKLGNNSYVLVWEDRSGSADDPTGKFGAASLTAAMLDEGAGARSALQIADEIEFLGATLTTTSSFDASAVRLNVPVRRLEAALAVMADVKRRVLLSVNPAFERYAHDLGD